MRIVLKKRKEGCMHLSEESLLCEIFELCEHLLLLELYSLHGRILALHYWEPEGLLSRETRGFKSTVQSGNFRCVWHQLPCP